MQQQPFTDLRLSLLTARQVGDMAGYNYVRYKQPWLACVILIIFIIVVIVNKQHCHAAAAAANLKKEPA